MKDYTPNNPIYFKALDRMPSTFTSHVFMDRLRILKISEKEIKSGRVIQFLLANCTRVSRSTWSKKSESIPLISHSEDGCLENESRATFIVNKKVLEEIKNIAYMDRLLIKDVVNTALKNELIRFENKGKQVASSDLFETLEMKIQIIKQAGYKVLKQTWDEL